MTRPKIETPRGSIVIGPNGKAELKWNTNFQPKWQKRFSEAQKFVDQSVLEICDDFYIPFRTGMLKESGILGTEVGSGLVQWIAPYARVRYYRARKEGTPTKVGKNKAGKDVIVNVGTPFEPLRGPFWFHRAKAMWKNYWIEGARKKIAGEK